MGISFIPDDQVNFTEARLSLGKQIAQICTFCGRTTKTEECRGWRFDRTSTGYCAVCPTCAVLAAKIEKENKKGE